MKHARTEDLRTILPDRNIASSNKGAMKHDNRRLGVVAWRMVARLFCQMCRMPTKAFSAARVVARFARLVWVRELYDHIHASHSPECCLDISESSKAYRTERKWFAVMCPPPLGRGGHTH